MLDPAHPRPAPHAWSRSPRPAVSRPRRASSAASSRRSASRSRRWKRRSARRCSTARARCRKLNDAGRVILADARRLIEGATTLKARAESIAHRHRGGTDARRRRDLSDRGADRLPEGSCRGIPESAGDALHRGPRRRGAAAARRRGAARSLCARSAISARTGTMEYLVSIPTVAVVAADHPLAAIKGPLGRDVLEACGAACPHRPHAGHRRLQRRHRQPPHLAVCRPDHAARLPARRLRLVPHADPHGARPYRRRPAGGARAQGEEQARLRRSTSSTSGPAAGAGRASG